MRSERASDRLLRVLRKEGWSVEPDDPDAGWFRLTHPRWNEQRSYLVRITPGSVDAYLQAMDADSVLAALGDDISVGEARFRLLLVHVDEVLDTMPAEQSRLKFVGEDIIRS
jgi:hypothetical protein